MNCLHQYKCDLINLGASPTQKKILENSFARWYFICDRIHVFPTKNIVLKCDLEYANIYKAAGFNVPIFLEKSEKIYKLFRKRLCMALDTEINYCVDISTKTDISAETDMSYLLTRPPPKIYAVTQNQINRLKKLYCGQDKYFNRILRNLLALYGLLGAENLHLSIPPIFQGVELFGSPLNTHNREYCSPFEMEKYFGSLGSFWDYIFHKNGVYLCNPPFDEELIKKAALKIVHDISSTKHKVLVIVTLPVWDSQTQNIYSVENFGLRFEGLEILKKSPYVKDHKILDKKKFPYWNYFTEKCVFASWTHLIILSNLNDVFYRKNFHIDDVLCAWKNFS